MSVILPKNAQAVIIGGGVVGCSVAYHLAKLGYTDVVLLERKKLTSGTTWHAAGLVGQMRSSLNLTQMVKYSGNLYETLEAETGMATGYRRPRQMAMDITSQPPQDIPLESIVDMRNYNAVLKKKSKRSKKQSKRKARR